MALENERVLYLNGEYVPESRGFVHFRDQGFTHGDAVFDTARTFGGKIYRLDEHIDRLFRSLRYLQLEPGLSKQEFIDISEEVARRNAHLLDDDEDYWIFQRVSRGARFPDGPGAQGGPTVIVESTPLPLKARAPLFRDGARAIVPSTRRVPPEAMSPNAKTHNYLNFVMASLERRPQPGEWPILLDTRGFLCEGNGSNVFTVKDGKVYTPKAQYVLAGISRQVIFELCEKNGVEVRETDIAPYDAAIADEMFISSTSLCMLGVSTFNGQRVGDAAFPGPITSQIMDAYKEDVGFDFVAQYLAHLD